MLEAYAYKFCVVYSLINSLAFEFIGRESDIEYRDKTQKRFAEWRREHPEDKERIDRQEQEVHEHDNEAALRNLTDEKVRSFVDEIRKVCAEISMPSVLAQVNRLQDLVQHSPINATKTKQCIVDLQSRFWDELKGQGFLHLNDKETAYYNEAEPFGTEVNQKFPSAIFELDEAGKCFALHRYTATVFHLMRVMELSIRALARCLQIPDPLRPAERNWGYILKEIHAGIEAKWPTTASRIAGDGNLFEDLYVSLDAVKNPWRNSTMHVEKKYTADEAEFVLMAVRGFMKRISARMDEDGRPFARHGP